MNPSPLTPLLEAAHAEFTRFGPPPDQQGPTTAISTLSASPPDPASPVSMAETFGHFPAEYSAIRRHVGVLHMPHRRVLRFTGEDVKDFLHRLVTCEVNGLEGGASVRGFQLSGKGRIVADFMLHHGEADTWIETDVFDLVPLRELLESRLFAEDVAIEDWTDQREKLVLYGPAAVALLGAVADAGDQGVDAAQRLANLPGTHHVVRCIGGVPVTGYREDDVAAIGLHLLVPPDAIVALYQKLLEAAGYDPEADADPDADYARQRREGLRGRPIGWAAYNTARIEAGSPLFHIDFGTDSLPGETTLLDRTVSFTKGCYLGQEIVARMKNLGHPKRLLVGLRLDDDRLPVAGAQVLEAAQENQGPSAAGAGGGAGGGGGAKVIGGVTSSTLSPIRGNTSIAFAVVKWGHHRGGQAVRLAAEGELVDATVQGLEFMGQG